MSLRQVKRCVDAQSRGDFNISPMVMSQTSPNPKPARVSCGRHYAANCSTCPWKVSAEGVRGRWMGHKYCNGACEWRWHGRINAGGTCVSKPAPTPPAITVTDGTSKRGTVTVQIAGGTMTQFSTSVNSSEVQDALRMLGRTTEASW